MSKLPPFPESYWISNAAVPHHPSLEEDISVDVVVVGAGITGITTAYLLTKAGKKVALLESGRPLHGTTGHTTAKITAQHDLIYAELLDHFGEEKTRLYYEANREAGDFIRRIVQEKEINCGWSDQDAVLYAQTDQGLDRIKKEYEAYRKLAIQGDFVHSAPLPFPVQGALVMHGQAQFHPIPYLTRLLEEIVQAGSLVFENTTVVGVDEGEIQTVKTQNGRQIRCRDVVSASHFPFADRKGMYFARMHAERSYVLAIELAGDYPGGMYLNVDSPVRSIRSVPSLAEGVPAVLLIGGEGHRAGQSAPTMKHYEALEAFAQQWYGKANILYRWSTQDLVTLDKVPYVGLATKSHPHLFVATGYRKWGMTNGTAAALLLADLVLGNENRYAELFDPSRFEADPMLKHFVADNANVAKELVTGKLERAGTKPEELERGEGGAVTVAGKQAGAYRDPEGVMHVVDTTCTHMGCETKWNDGDRTWDCPCHGSRFTYTGEVLEGPAKKPLTRLDVTSR